MRRSLAKFSESEASNQTPSLADFITTTSELRFSVHTATRAARQALGIAQACLQKSLLAAEVMNMSRTVTEDLAAAERGVLQRALARAKGNVTAAAEALGMSRATVYRKLRRLDLHRTH
jgi:DNA-binding NtrC family response regulator